MKGMGAVVAVAISAEPLERSGSYELMVRIPAPGSMMVLMGMAAVKRRKR